MKEWEAGKIAVLLFLSADSRDALSTGPLFDLRGALRGKTATD